MSKKSLIYTKSGDEGTTSLVSGTRVHKSNDRIDLYGDLDELNSLIGFFLSSYNGDKTIIEFYTSVQKDLFVMGSNIACEKEQRVQFKLPVLGEESILRIEKIIDSLDEKLPQLKNFILPGGVDTSSRLHLCRTFTRRVERKMAYFDKNIEQVPDNYLIFLNRLSDCLFVSSRFVNFQASVKETTWP